MREDLASIAIVLDVAIWVFIGAAISVAVIRFVRFRLFRRRP
jgi:hypothetical protein